MGLKSVFVAGVNTAFKIFNEAVHTDVPYKVMRKTGWDGKAGTVLETKSIRVIQDSFTQEDINLLSFGKDIQPTDIKGMVPGEDLGTITPKTGDLIELSTGTLTVVAFDTDPYRVLFTILLRNA